MRIVIEVPDGAYEEICEARFPVQDAYRLVAWIMGGTPLPEQQAKTGWIPVTERLPEEENKNYWICTDGGYQCECRWTNVNHFWTHLTRDWHWHIMDIPQHNKVIAWMPLPEPYVPDTNVGEMSESEVQE